MDQKSVQRPAESSGTPAARLYTLVVTILSGRMTEAFWDANPTVSRTIEIRGKQSLEDLHFAIFDSFNRFEEHLYEFQLGKKAYDRKAVRYPMATEYDDYEEDDPFFGGYADETTLDSLELRLKRKFYYYFDFGDSWYHEVQVIKIGPAPPRGKFPKVTARVGKSPPQYPNVEW